MTTTLEPRGEPIASHELRRTVTALIVDAATAHAAVWRSDEHDAGPADVRVVVAAVDSSGREHHLSLSPNTTGAFLSSLTVAHQEALRLESELS